MSLFLCHSLPVADLLMQQHTLTLPSVPLKVTRFYEIYQVPVGGGLAFSPLREKEEIGNTTRYPPSSREGFEGAGAGCFFDSQTQLAQPLVRGKRERKRRRGRQGEFSVEEKRKKHRPFSPKLHRWKGMNKQASQKRRNQSDTTLQKLALSLSSLKSLLNTTLTKPGKFCLTDEEKALEILIVLQLRIQNRRQQNELNAESGKKATVSEQPGEKDISRGLRQTEDSGSTQKSPPCGLTAQTAPAIHSLISPPFILQLFVLARRSAEAASLVSDAFEDDNSSSASASPEQLGMHQSPSFSSSSPGQGGDQSLSDVSPVATPVGSNNLQQCRLALLPATECISQPMPMTVHGSNSALTGRPKGMYMPSQTPPLLPKTAQLTNPASHSILGGSLTSSRPPRPRKPRDSKPKMRKLKYHQYIPPDQRTGTGSGTVSQKNSNSQLAPDSSSSHVFQQQQVFLQLQVLNQPTITNRYLELRLKVSVLRQQLRKRGLPVSGTKPALLERLRPFQIPHPPPNPQLGATLESSHPSNLSQIPTNVHATTNPATLYSLSPGSSDGYLTSPSSAGSSPTLFSSSPLPSGSSWRASQGADELSLEEEMRERFRGRPREGAVDSQLCGTSHHPFLQQDTGSTKGRSETSGNELHFTYCIGDGKINCCELWDTIGQDYELPMQITASPLQASPMVRSLEEELQEAIQRVQMDSSQSIDDILDGIFTSSDNSILITDVQSAAAVVPASSPGPQPDQSQSTKHQKSDNFLSSPLCSSLLLEPSPSPYNTQPLGSTAAPLPPPPICTTPPSILLSRKRRSDIPAFDPAEWLETLTSGMHPLMPPAAPFQESDFGLDSDLNLNKVLDLMVENW
ncbi:hypothetical protein DNTS_017870 [Danionella cerebrum]|uniref:SAP domain-containing protein n=1 Tax=Danionella cerebrum TaxID=2873325 RepID=A0A553N214_9TELE|nr:hypothetical protein DNTS_017870 [Danionella translucida]